MACYPILDIKLKDGTDNSIGLNIFGLHCKLFNLCTNSYSCIYCIQIVVFLYLLPQMMSYVCERILRRLLRWLLSKLIWLWLLWESAEGIVHWRLGWVCHERVRCLSGHRGERILPTCRGCLRLHHHVGLVLSCLRLRNHVHHLHVHLRLHVAHWVWNKGLFSRLIWCCCCLRRYICTADIAKGIDRDLSRLLHLWSRLLRWLPYFIKLKDINLSCSHRPSSFHSSRKQIIKIYSRCLFWWLVVKVEVKVSRGRSTCRLLGFTCRGIFRK